MADLAHGIIYALNTMASKDYSNRELDSHFIIVKETLDRIERQTIKTNGRVTKLEKNILILACVVGTVIVMNFPEVMNAIKIFI